MHTYIICSIAFDYVYISHTHNQIDTSLSAFKILQLLVIDLPHMYNNVYDQYNQTQNE